MTESLPGRAGSVRAAAVDVASWTALHALPRMPDGVKRVLLGGRSVTVDGNTLDTTLQLMLAGQRLVRLDGLVVSRDVAIARAKLRAQARMLPGHLPADVTGLVIPGPAGPIPARHYRTAQVGAPLLVFYHGGGFVIGDLDTHDRPCRRICADAGVHVLSVDYRRAPEDPAPAAVDDAYAAYRWASEHATELGADPDRVAVGGDSAGGNLATVVAQRARNEGGRLPALQLLVYPVTNWTADTRSKNLFAEGYYLTRRHLDWFAERYLAGSGIDPADPVVSPLLAGDLSGLPPAVVLTAGFDPLRDEGTQYADALRAAGVPVELREFGALVHGFLNLFPLGGGSAHAIAELITALRAHLNRG